MTSYKAMMDRARPKYYDMETQQLGDHMAWSRYRETLGEGHSLRHDYVGNYRISTVYVGLDMGFMNPFPLIFETMIFVEDGKKDDLDLGLWMDRYTWKQQALEGHEIALRLARGEITRDEAGGC